MFYFLLLLGEFRESHSKINNQSCASLKDFRAPEQPQPKALGLDQYCMTIFRMLGYVCVVCVYVYCISHKII